MRTASLALWFAVLMLSGGLVAHAGTAERAYRKGDLARARRLYEERLRRQPEDSKARYNLGNVQYRSEDLKAAEEAYQGALRSDDPGLRARAAHNLGNALLRSGQIDGAIQSYVEALRAEPGNPDSKYNLELALRLRQQPPPQQQQQQKQDQQKQDQPQQQQQQQQQQHKQQESQQEQSQQEQQQPNQAPAPAPGDYSRQEAERVLDGLAQEERQLLEDRLRAQGRDLRVEKDW